jgi:antitoxin (DNA-binding transcriptional repressor) of toxin-antitoxin stability system
MQIRIYPDLLRGRASARIVAGPAARRRAQAPRSASGSGDSPLQAIYAAVERMNERSGAIVVPID